MGHELSAHGTGHNRLGPRGDGMLPRTQVGIEQLIRRHSEGHRLLDCPRHSGLLATGGTFGYWNSAICQKGSQVSSRSINYLIRPQEQRLRNRQTDRLRGVEIDAQLELGGLLDREVGWLRALEDLIDEDGGPPGGISDARRVVH